MKDFSEYASVLKVTNRKRKKGIRVIFIWSIFLFTVICFLPWTQNIQANGSVTALNPSNRPQEIQTIIAGRIEKWFISEGDFVKKGDTLVYISEVKSEYFDPKLIERTESAMKSKESSAKSYMDKVSALDSQIDALIDSRIAKLAQAQNKIKQGKYKISSDSADFVQADKQLAISKDQYKRAEELYRQKLISLTELENRRLKVQEGDAKVISLENKLQSSRNDYYNSITELRSIDADYRDKISKSESEKSSTMSGLFDTEAQVTKMQNDVSNYQIRSGYYFITAPQDGYISKAVTSGIGETVKEGQALITIVPTLSDCAVEYFASPMDLPLLHVGNDVRLQFDGWPAIVFSGWPQVSYGTYGGKITAIDNYIGPNGKYRILVAPDLKDHPWPTGLRIGVAVRSMTLLNDVSIGYELWRNINGFPPNYYLPKKTNNFSAEKDEKKK
jgi:membrane fusion protein, adhesin transport system